MSARILVIDDDESLLEMFQLVLEAEGYDVHLSNVTYEDVKDVEALHPSLIILLISAWRCKLFGIAGGFMQKVAMRKV